MAQIPEYFYILMKDVNGEKNPKFFGLNNPLASAKSVQVLRGELLTPIPPRERVQLSDGRILHNYRCWKDPNILLYSVEDNVTPLIANSSELQLLQAIEKPFDRFAVFSDDKKLEWGGRLRKGDQVCVKLPGDNPSTPTWSPAVVKYVGPVDGLSGRIFGVEITVARYLGKGTSDGWFRGYQYFECDHDCAVFVSLDKLVAELPHQVPQGAISKPTSSKLPASYTKAPDMSVDKTTAHHKFRIHDRVVVYNKQNKPTHGIVQWVGRNVRSRTLDSTHVGIETDSAVIYNHFPKAVPGINYLFQATPGHRLVVPETHVFREELANPRRTSHAIDLSSAAAVAREDNLSERQLMAKQHQILKEAEKKKKEKKKVEESTCPAELNELKDALNESVHVSQQKQMMEQFEKTGQEENRRKREAQAAKTQQPTGQTGGSSTQRQNSWQAGGDNPVPDKRTSPPTTNTRSGPSTNTRSKITPKVSQERSANAPKLGPCQFRMDERVMVYDKQGKQVFGRVRWYGDGTKKRRFGFMAVGIETDANIFLSEFEGYIPSADQHGVSKLRWLLMPETMVISAEQKPARKKLEQSPVDLDSSLSLAKQFGMTKEDIIADERKVLLESNEKKQQHAFSSRQYQSSSSQLDCAQPQQQLKAKVGNSNLYNLGVGSPVQIARTDPNDPPYYGVIRWIGYVSGVDGTVAGIELNEYLDGCTDGVLKSTGEMFFSCAYGHGLYFPLCNLSPDRRFTTVSTCSPTGLNSSAVIQDKDDVSSGLKQEIDSLRKKIDTLNQNLESEQAQNREHVKRGQIISQQLVDKEEQIKQLEYQRQQAENESRRQSQRYQHQITDLQRRLEVAEIKTSESKFTKVQIPQQDEDSWNIRRQEITLQNELGHGAWGAVYRGMFRGRPVAVKCAHRQILHETTIEQLKREIRIMAHVQHPNLVRLLAAVVDDQAQRKRDSPLLVLELLDTDLRSAYKEKIVSFDRNGLVPIFRDVAYALHYLHEHQEPIIHRDVSAPNVLLQKIAPGVWKAKLSDFGSANLAKHCKTSAPGAIVYAAPEIFPPSDPDSPLPKQTTKIDVFSYGYLLVEAFGKKMPSPDKRKSMLEDIKRDWRQLYDIVKACIEYKPDNRLTMTQVLEKLNVLS